MLLNSVKWSCKTFIVQPNLTSSTMWFSLVSEWSRPSMRTFTSVHASETYYKTTEIYSLVPAAGAFSSVRLDSRCKMVLFLLREQNLANQGFRIQSVASYQILRYLTFSHLHAGSFASSFSADLRRCAHIFQPGGRHAFHWRPYHLPLS